MPMTEGFFASLGMLWHKPSRCWRSRITPALCHRFVNECPLPIEASDEVLEAARSFSEAIEAGFSVESGEVPPQPKHRKTDGWNHQLRALKFSSLFEASMLALRMGEGKSWCGVNLAVTTKSNVVLVLCPLAVCGVWRREFAKHSAVDYTVLVVDRGSMKDKAEKIRRAVAMAGLHNQPVAIVINYDSCWRAQVGEAILETDWHLVICDESHRIKSPTSNVSKFCAKLTHSSRRRLALTGTPMPNNPGDLFGQFRFLDPSLFGRSWTRFKLEFALMNPHIPQKVDRWINEDELQRRFRMIAFRVADEVLDLPPINHVDIACTLGRKGADAYRQMKRDMIAEIEDGSLTASNGMVKFLRLQQMTGGAMLDQVSGEVKTIDTAKRDALAGLLEDVSEPFVVFCRFRHDLEQVRAVAAKLGRSYGEISGTQRDLTEHSMMPDGIDVMGVQIQSGGTGIDLTRARLAAYYSVGLTPGDFDQSVARLHRPGQEHPVVMYHLICEGTIDEHIYRALQTKRDLIETVMEALRR